MNPKDQLVTYTYTEHSIEQSLVMAREAGWLVEPVYGDEHTLLLDLDSPESEVTYQKNFEIATRRHWIDLIETERWRSKSGNTHVVLKTSQTLNLRERSALQAFLGSDLTRELCSWYQAREGETGAIREDPHVLFRPKTLEKAITDQVDEERAELGIEGNFGFALLGKDLQSGECEFCMIEDTGDALSERLRASKAALFQLRSRLRRPGLLYYFGKSHPYGR